MISKIHKSAVDRVNLEVLIARSSGKSSNIIEDTYESKWKQMILTMPMTRQRSSSAYSGRIIGFRYASYGIIASNGPRRHWAINLLSLRARRPHHLKLFAPNGSSAKA